LKSRKPADGIELFELAEAELEERLIPSVLPDSLACGHRSAPAAVNKQPCQKQVQKQTRCAQRRKSLWPLSVRDRAMFGAFFHLSTERMMAAFRETTPGRSMSTHVVLSSSPSFLSCR